MIQNLAKENVNQLIFLLPTLNYVLCIPPTDFSALLALVTPSP